MKRSIFIALGLLALAMLASASTVRANEVGTLTLTNCGTMGTGCPGATYTFNIGSTSATLTITINSPVNSTNDTITGVDLGFTPSNNVSGLSLVGGASGWVAETGSLSNSGCGGNPGAFICASGPGISITDGGTYTFTWDYTLGGGSIDSIGDVHIGANYGPANGLIVSETGAVATTPEPSSLILLGVGLLGLGGYGRRRLFS